jgi:hypothetical protein
MLNSSFIKPSSFQRDPGVAVAVVADFTLIPINIVIWWDKKEKSGLTVSLDIIQ